MMGISTRQEAPKATARSKNSPQPHARQITYNGVTDSLYGWASKLGLKEQTLRKRIDKLEWSMARALSTPARKWGKK